MSRDVPSRQRRALFLAGILCAATVLCVVSSLPLARAASPSNRSPSNSAATRDEKSSEAHMTKLKLRVLTNDGKPVGNASVYIRFYADGGFLNHDKLAELDLKTNQDGSVKVPEIPQGKILIQVIAKGWHTFGKWYEVEKDEESIVINLEPPPHWY
jgi:hypothetical protein